MNDQTRLKYAIASVVAQKLPSKENRKALKAIRWAMYAPAIGFYAGLAPLGNIVPIDDVECAQVFDGRDNEEMKLKYYRAVTSIHWEVKLL